MKAEDTPITDPDAEQRSDPAPSDAAAVVGEAYWDIVWQQFRKNRQAYISLWLLGPLLLLAIVTPAIASNQPFIYFDGDQVLFPWARALFNTAEPVDFLFNIALIALLPGLALAVVTIMRGRRKAVPGRRQALLVAAQFVGIIIALCVVFSMPNPWNRGTFLLRPNNKYGARTFVDEEFQARKQDESSPARYGIYPPLPFGPLEIDTPARFREPGYRKAAEEWQDLNDDRTHLLGTDDTGRDVLTRMLYGTRISMSVGFVAVGIYITIGVIVGALAGYFGGWVDMLISRVIEVVLLFPAFFLMLTMVALVGPSIYIVMVVIGITGWPTVARLIRGEVLKQRTIDYTTAARALGASHLRIIFRHILPNAVSPALVTAPFGIAGAIVTEAALSLLGFGVRPPAPSWGAILRLGYGNFSYWWLIVIPSAAIFFTVTVFNLVGSGLRDAMDPRLRI